MSKFIFGLNTASDLAQVENKTQALRNLGIDIEDLDVIRGLSDAGVTATDLRNLSGLDVDFRKELKRLNEGVSAYRFLLSELTDNSDIYSSNLFTSGKIGAESVRYNYYDFADNTVKVADISTSRLSVWSSFDESVTETSPIFYGGKLEIIEDGSNSGKLRTTELSVTDSPIPLEFASETATHLVTLNINGVPTQFYAMKGIPLEFDAFFRSGSFRINVSRLPGSPNPSWKIIDQDSIGTVRRYTNVAVNFTGSLSDITARPRKMQFFYNPARITEIVMPNLQISDFELPVMNLLTTLDLSFNDLKSVPDLANITPGLLTLILTGNNLTRSSETMNTQIARLPQSLTRLEVSGSFSDSTFVDMSSVLPNLQRMVHDANYTSRNRRNMNHTGSTHAVSSTIREYFIRGHRYQSLHESLSTAPELRRIYIGNNNITGLSNGNEITFASTNLTEFDSDYGNRHNVVNVNGKANLTVYKHRHARNLVGSSTIENKFTGCNALREINFYACDATGAITETFKDLENLLTLDLRYTRLQGNIDNNTFSGTAKLRNLFISGGLFNSENFFSAESMYNIPDIRTIIVSENRQIRGTLPDFSRNINLNTLYISSTGLSGNIPVFASNRNLRTLTLNNGKTATATGFVGGMPAISSDTLTNINFNNNSLTSTLESPFPVLECRNLSNLALFNNSFAGPIGDFSKCLNLITINLGNNQFSSYQSGSLRNCTKLRTLIISNNRLTLNAFSNLMIDMLENYNLNNRSGVNLNLLGNLFTQSDVESDNITKNAVDFLRSQGWTIIF
jgi:hypothetical protein